MTNYNPKLNAVRSIMNSPNLLKIIKDGLSAPVGSTKRQAARNVLAVSNTLRQNYSGAGGAGFGNLLQPAGFANDLATTYNPTSAFNPQQGANLNVMPQSNVGNASLTVQPAPTSNQPLTVQQPQAQPQLSGVQQAPLQKRDIVTGIPLPKSNVAPSTDTIQPIGVDNQELIPPYGSNREGLVKWYQENPENFQKWFGGVSGAVTPLGDYERPADMPSAMWNDITTAVENRIGKETWTYQVLPKLKEYFPDVPEEELPIGSLWTDELPEIKKRLREEYQLESQLNNLQNMEKEGFTVEEDLQSYIRGRDKYIDNIDKMIDSVNNLYVTSDVSDPTVRKLLDKYRKYLYINKGRQTMRYNQYVKTSLDEFNARYKSLTNEYNDSVKLFNDALTDEKEITKERYTWYKNLLGDLYDNLEERESLSVTGFEKEIDKIENLNKMFDTVDEFLNPGQLEISEANKIKSQQNYFRANSGTDVSDWSGLSYEEKVKWIGGEEEEDGIDATERKIIGGINDFKRNNKSIKYIEEYILSNGYKPSDFMQYYSGYKPDIVKGIEFMLQAEDGDGNKIYDDDDIKQYIIDNGEDPEDYEEYYKSWLQRIF